MAKTRAALGRVEQSHTPVYLILRFLLAQGRSRLLRGMLVCRDAQKHKVIHKAAHRLLVREDPFRSGVVTEKHDFVSFSTSRFGWLAPELQIMVFKAFAESNELVDFVRLTECCTAGRLKPLPFPSS